MPDRWPGQRSLATCSDRGNAEERRAQVVIQTADEILSALQDDPVFMSLVGTYTFADGFTAPSIAVVGSNEFIDGLGNVDGLEVVINRVPTTTSRPLYSGCIPPEKGWTIHLIQYTSGNVAVNAADLLLARYPGASYSALGAGTLPDIAGLEQIVVKIPSNVNA